MVPAFPFSFRKTPGSLTSGEKKSGRFRPPFGSSLKKDYLLILRRRTIAKAPRPNRLIVAGSGTAWVPVKLAVK